MKVYADFQLHLDGDIFENVVFDGHFIEFENTEDNSFKVGQNILISEVNLSNMFTGRKSLEKIKQVIVNEERNVITLIFEDLHNNHLTDRVSIALSKKYLKTVYDMKVSLYNLREIALSNKDKQLIQTLSHNLKGYDTVGEKKNFIMTELKQIQQQTGDITFCLYISNILDFNK
ncbi:hypothetical protein P9X10_01525 [Bacillus cereus]|nr:hypothetical protein [Bacillus cereus]